MWHNLFVFEKGEYKQVKAVIKQTENSFHGVNQTFPILNVSGLCSGNTLCLSFMS